MIAPAPVTAEEAPALAAIHAASFAAPWSAGDLAGLATAPGALAYKVPAVGPAEGFILMRAAGGEAEIVTLAVLPAARRKGVAAMLVRHAIAALAEQGVAALHLEVAADNHAAGALYAGLGFAETGRRPGYYRQGRARAVDALILSLALVRLPAGRDGSHVRQNPV